MTDECPHCGQPMPEPYESAVRPAANPIALLLAEWNAQVNAGLPSHDLRTAEQWIRPILPALRARAGQSSPVPLWSATLTAWLARKGGKRPALRWFCQDAPDLLTDVRPAEVPRTTRLFPVVPPDTTPVADPAVTAEGLQSVRDVLAGLRRG